MFLQVHTSPRTRHKGEIIARTGLHNGVPSGFIDNVVGRASDSSQVAGTSICASGYTTNKVACASVYFGPGTQLIENGVKLVGNLACGFFTDVPGDSGGSVYVPEPGNAGKAAGVIDVVSEGPFNRIPIFTYFNGDGPLSCYTTIDSVLQGISAHNQGVPAYVVDANGSFS